MDLIGKTTPFPPDADPEGLWHGDRDTTISYKNLAESVKQWSNILGLDYTTPTSAVSRISGYTGQSWSNACGTLIIEAFTAAVAHAVPINGDAIASFFGLDQTGLDPGLVACP